MDHPQPASREGRFAAVGQPQAQILEPETLRREARSAMRQCKRLLASKLRQLRSDAAIGEDAEAHRRLVEDIAYLEDLIERNERFLSQTE